MAPMPKRHTVDTWSPVRRPPGPLAPEFQQKHRRLTLERSPGVSSSGQAASPGHRSKTSPLPRWERAPVVCVCVFVCCILHRGRGILQMP
jgi:hypothetical protein